jgi:ATP phosphoribosyltransferase
VALTNITPVPAQVRWDRRHARPTSVQIGDRQLRVTGLDAVRDEMAAYPAARGPRITFLVETDAGQASLVFDARQRRWYVEALDQAA